MPPTSEDDEDELVAFQIRLPRRLVREIEERRLKVGERSRNKWIERALEWAVRQPVKTETSSRKVST